MATIQKFLVWDITTLANFTSWASAISASLATMGLVRTNDTGQVVWTASVVAITAATLSGSNLTCTYTLSSGPVLRVGMSLVITGLTNSGNNGTFTITALGTGTFTVVNASGVTETGSSGSGTTTAIASVPQTVGATSYVYEVWQFNDALASTCPIVMKVLYGTAQVYTNVSAVKQYSPSFGISVGAASNGSGGIIGNGSGLGNISTTLYYSGTNNNPITVGTGASLWECDFSYDSGRITILLWRDNTNVLAPGMLSIERSRDTFGNYTASYFSFLGTSSAYDSVGVVMHYYCPQETVYPQGYGGVSYSSYASGGYFNSVSVTGTTTVYGSSFAVLPIFPLTGKIDNPLTSVVIMKTGDQTEGALVSVKIYGTSHNYLYSKQTVFQGAAPGGTCGVAIRWD